ncbi:DUF2971 domain-containing protein [Pseudomonas mandelii]
MLGYKYRAINKYSLETLTNNTVYFSKHTDFNDPFEFSTPFPDLKRMYTEVSIGVDRLLAQKNISIENHKHLKKICQIIIKEKSSSLDKIHEKIKQTLETTGVYSLSKTNDEILMWSHYADNHKGFCIGFENLHQNTTPVTKPLPINYTDQYTDLSSPELILEFYKKMYGQYISLPDALWKKKYLELGKETKFLDDQRGGIAVLTDKYEKWSYEQEFRLIDQKGFGLRPFNSICLKTITFGLRTSSHDIETIVSICKNKKTNIEFYKTQKEKNTFALKVIRID